MKDNSREREAPRVRLRAKFCETSLPVSNAVQLGLEQLSPRPQPVIHESMCRNYLSPHTTEPVLCNKRSHCNENRVHHNKE